MRTGGGLEEGQGQGQGRWGTVGERGLAWGHCQEARGDLEAAGRGEGGSEKAEGG